MILADSSIWIDHFRSPSHDLEFAIRSNGILVHRMLVGELALGWVPDRINMLTLLQAMPMIGDVPDDDLMMFVEHHQLISVGI
jgi:predicted nucleic acid-binding protein